VRNRGIESKKQSKRLSLSLSLCVCGKREEEDRRTDNLSQEKTFSLRSSVLINNLMLKLRNPNYPPKEKKRTDEMMGEEWR